MTTAQKGTLSVQLYTFRDAYAADPDGTLERLAGLGFRAVEPFAVGSAGQPGEEHLKRAQALKRSLDAAGLSSPSAHVGAPVGEYAEAVLDAIYAAYTKGWSEVGDRGVPEMAGEAIWLGRLLVAVVDDGGRLQHADAGDRREEVGVALVDRADVGSEPDLTGVQLDDGSCPRGSPVGYRVRRNVRDARAWTRASRCARRRFTSIGLSSRASRVSIARFRAW